MPTPVQNSKTAEAQRDLERQNADHVEGTSREVDLGILSTWNLALGWCNVRIDWMGSHQRYYRCPIVTAQALEDENAYVQTHAHNDHHQQWEADADAQKPLNA
ncbi:MAG: hypothetical protein LQ346_007523 [Caloplaca aetnensis]|nr:MAG: hypothetical protein LQ346_007523 [Caloplaca aetnensis]